MHSRPCLLYFRGHRCGPKLHHILVLNRVFILNSPTVMNMKTLIFTSFCTHRITPVHPRTHMHTQLTFLIQRQWSRMMQYGPEQLSISGVQVIRWSRQQCDKRGWRPASASPPREEQRLQTFPQTVRKHADDRRREWTLRAEDVLLCDTDTFKSFHLG